MNRCSHCEMENEINRLYCESCSMALSQWLDDQKKKLAQTVLIPPPTSAVVPHAPAIMVTIALMDGKRFVLKGYGTFGVGRADMAMGWLPAVDLAKHGGELGGVSRRHAQFERTKQHTYIIDIGSTNGIKLNGHLVEPRIRHMVKTGDELLFGRVLARIESIL